MNDFVEVISSCIKRLTVCIFPTKLVRRYVKISINSRLVIAVDFSKYLCHVYYMGRALWKRFVTTVCVLASVCYLKIERITIEIMITHADVWDDVNKRNENLN